MTLPRFHLPGAIGSHAEIEGDAAHHALRAQRLKTGDHLILFNGEGGEYEGVISRCGKDTVAIEVLQFRAIERESPLHISLAQGISGADNMDFTIQKAVELGVARIQPLATARSVVRLSDERARKRVEHWRRVVISACEQCGRNRLPQVEEVVELEKWLTQLEGDGLRLLLSPRASERLGALAKPQAHMWLLAGPEGGFDAAQENAALSMGFRAISLGPRILRTETTALAALSATQALWGDF